MTGALRKFWGDKRQTAEIKPGLCFSRALRHNIIEIATVVGLRNDHGGIPHVHFSLAFEQEGHGRVDGDHRVLALPSFMATYQHQRA
jgi:hypothetical protein